MNGQNLLIYYHEHFETMTLLQYFLVPEAVAQTTDFPGTRGNVMQGHDETPKLAKEWWGDVTPKVFAKGYPRW